MNTLDLKARESDTGRTLQILAHVAKLEADRTMLRNALVGLVGADTKAELDGMEMFIRINPAPDDDRVTTINAIHALRETLPL